MSILLTLLVAAAQAAEVFEDRLFVVGDLHAHTGASQDGGSSDLGTCDTDCGALAEATAAARALGHDFVALTDHVNGEWVATAEDYARVRDTLLAGHDPEGGFLTLVGAELSLKADGRSLGHKNLYVFATNEALADWTIDAARFDGDAVEIEDCAALWEWVAEVEARWGPVLLLPHHPALASGMGTDWTCHLDSQAATYAPVVESYSRHGDSMPAIPSWDPPWNGPWPAGAVETALDPDRFGLRLGFVGGTDSRDTRPGEVCRLDTEHDNHPYGGGLTIAVLDPSETFERPALHAALVDGRTYATSGPFLPAVVEYASGGELLGGMGEELSIPAGQDLDVILRVPEDREPTIVEAVLVGPGFELGLAPSGGGTWTTSVAGAEVPDFLYVDVVVDGEAWYGAGGCADGGEDTVEHVWVSPTWFESGPDDMDGDGQTVAEGDCDDGDPDVYRGAAEDCGSGVDEDCDGLVDEADPDCAPEDTAASTDTAGPDSGDDTAADADTAPPAGEAEPTGKAGRRCGCGAAPAGGGLPLGVLALRRQRDTPRHRPGGAMRGLLVAFLTTLALVGLACGFGGQASKCPAAVAVTNGWQGEYPTPVVQVKREATLPARADPCDIEADRRCTVAPGLYHPWAGMGGGKAPGTGYRTLRSIRRYVALGEVRFEYFPAGSGTAPRTIGEGTVVEVRYYAGEGMCDMVLEGVSFQDMCPDMLTDPANKPLFRRLDGPATDDSRQFFATQCKEGFEGWIEVTDRLMQRKDVVEGAITGYGSVGPAGSAP